MNIDCWTREFVLFLRYIWILGSILQIIAGKAFTYSGHLKKKLQVAEVDNAGGRCLKMLE